jgi:SAM-dependent methyltransferase
VRHHAFDAVLCALVGEHLSNLSRLFRELFNGLVPGGRMVFSVFHPVMASAGLEANFEEKGVDYRLGAYQHTTDDYLGAIGDAGFCDPKTFEFCGDQILADEVPGAAKYFQRPLLLLVEARKT